jgi:hypothetical protein
MTPFLYTLVAGYVLVACVKGYHSAKLLEQDPEAWERLQHHEEEKRRWRQETLGKVTLAVARTVAGWFKRDTEEP